ncbi:hypothetical protein PGTUg99_002514 [Puccinia graminis f. sp. tritici]|uniref:Uncharacterized protein n=1 Tax=Puccinia graminis f. sp. tritici TaxID=56615 RepID=A0A5B0SJ38_PUCGR|nr:hypothetical protein PGTUg99_002514 [Puccinia graminis f. sp. tritici]
MDLSLLSFQLLLQVAYYCYNIIKVSALPAPRLDDQNLFLPWDYNGLLASPSESGRLDADIAVVDRDNQKRPLELEDSFHSANEANTFPTTLETRLSASSSKRPRPTLDVLSDGWTEASSTNSPHSNHLSTYHQPDLQGFCGLDPQPSYFQHENTNGLAGSQVPYYPIESYFETLLAQHGSFADGWTVSPPSTSNNGGSSGSHNNAQLDSILTTNFDDPIWSELLNYQSLEPSGRSEGRENGAPQVLSDGWKTYSSGISGLSNHMSNELNQIFNGGDNLCFAQNGETSGVLAGPTTEFSPANSLPSNYLGMESISFSYANSGFKFSTPDNQEISDIPPFSQSLNYGHNHMKDNLYPFQMQFKNYHENHKFDANLPHNQNSQIGSHDDTDRDFIPNHTLPSNLAGKDSKSSDSTKLKIHKMNKIVGLQQQRKLRVLK